LQDGISALQQDNDTSKALTHLKLAYQQLTSIGENSSTVQPTMILLQDGISALQQDNDTSKTLVYMKLAYQRLSSPTSTASLPSSSPPNTGTSKVLVVKVPVAGNDNHHRPYLTHVTVPPINCGSIGSSNNSGSRSSSFCVMGKPDSQPISKKTKQPTTTTQPPPPSPICVTRYPDSVGSLVKFHANQHQHQQQIHHIVINLNQPLPLPKT
jgi:hypothetical protein